MDGQSSIDRSQQLPLVAALAQELAPLLAGVLIFAHSLAALALCGRRMAGALAVVDSTVSLVVWILLAAVVALVARATWCARHARATLLADAVVICVPCAALVLTALVFSTVQAPLLVVLLVWGIVLVEEGVALGFLRQRGSRGVAENPPTFWRRVMQGLQPAGQWGDREIRPRREVWHPDPARRATAENRCQQEIPRRTSKERLTQRLERVQACDGGDEMTGALAMQLAARQVNVHFHVAFCPPFAGTPHVVYRQVAGPAARVKLGQVLPHGARFDVKLDAPQNEAAQVVLEVRAAHPAPRTPDA